MIDRRTMMIGSAALGAQPARRASGLAALADPARADAVMAFAVMARDRGGRMVLAEAHGHALRGVGAAARRFAFTLDTPVRVASISKLATAAVFMTQIAAGRIGLDDDVSQALGARVRHPGFPDVLVTPRRLASHTAGLRDGPDYPVPVGARLVEALTSPAWWSPASEPPGVYAYSNTGAPVLAQLVERLAGERFDQAARRLLFAPLGLEVGFNWSGVGQVKRGAASACARRVDGVWTAQVDAEVPRAPEVRAGATLPGLTLTEYRVGENGFACSPQGGLRASVRDLDALAVAFGRGRVPGLSRQALAAMLAPAWRYDGGAGVLERGDGLIRAYGLGVQVPGGAASDAFFGAESSDWRGHLGEAYGLLSGLWWNMRDGRTLCWLIPGVPTREDAPLPRGRTALTPWEEAIITAALTAG